MARTVTRVFLATFTFAALVEGFAYTHVVLFKYAVTPPAAVRVYADSGKRSSTSAIATASFFIISTSSLSRIANCIQQLSDTHNLFGSMQLYVLFGLLIAQVYP